MNTSHKKPTSKHPFSAAVLAGGYGKRLGQDKANAEVAGKPLLEWTTEALRPLSMDLLVVKRYNQYLPMMTSQTSWRTIIDKRPNAGPLAGIEAALEEITNDVMIIVGCDMPLIQPDLLRAIAAKCHDNDMVIPLLNGMSQPLLAAYRTSCLPVVKQLLDSGEGRIRKIIPYLKCHHLTENDLNHYDPELISFTNVNYPADLRHVDQQLNLRKRQEL